MLWVLFNNLYNNSRTRVNLTKLAIKLDVLYIYFHPKQLKKKKQKQKREREKNSSISC